MAVSELAKVRKAELWAGREPRLTSQLMHSGWTCDNSGSLKKVVMFSAYIGLVLF